MNKSLNEFGPLFGGGGKMVRSGFWELDLGFVGVSVKAFAHILRELQYDTTLFLDFPNTYGDNTNKGGKE